MKDDELLTNLICSIANKKSRMKFADLVNDTLVEKIRQHTPDSERVAIAVAFEVGKIITHLEDFIDSDAFDCPAITNFNAYDIVQAASAARDEQEQIEFIENEVYPLLRLAYKYGYIQGVNDTE